MVSIRCLSCLSVRGMLLFAACLLAPVWLAAEPISLQQSVTLALEHAPAMLAAEADRDATLEDKNIGRAVLLPYVEATGSIQQRRQNTIYDKPQNFFKTDLNYRENFIGLRLVQPLFDLERWAAYRKGETSSTAGELRFRLEQQKLILETVLDALEVTTSQASLEAAKAHESAAHKLAAEAKVAYKAGLKSKTEKLLAQSRFDLARAEKRAAQSRLERACATLTSLTGVAVDRVTSPAVAARPVVPHSSEHWEALAAEHALPVLLARQRLEIAKEDRQRSTGAALPKVEAFAEAGRGRSGDSMLNSASTLRSQAVGVQVRLPLYAGGGTTAQMRKSEKEVAKAEYDLVNDIRLARLAAQQAYLTMKDAAVQIEAMKQAEVSARQAAEVAHAAYKAGLSSITEVLDSEEQRYRAERDVAIAKARFVAAALQLRASIGKLDGEPLPAYYGGS